MLDLIAVNRPPAHDDAPEPTAAEEAAILVITIGDEAAAVVIAPAPGAAARLTMRPPGAARVPSPAAPTLVLTRGALQIELDRRRVRVAERAVHLQPKEFALLTAFALEPGRVFTRKDLLEALWGEDAPLNTRVVDVHVSWLRSKLAEAGFTGGIVTVHGVGYRFVALPGDGADQRADRARACGPQR